MVTTKKKKEVLIHYHSDHFTLEHVDDKDVSNAVDLYTNEDMVLEVATSHKIDLGISLKLPNGYKADLKPRGSTFGKFGLIQTNSVGLIDTAYCGKDDRWSMPVYVMPTQADYNDMFDQNNEAIREMFTQYAVQNKRNHLERFPHKAGAFVKAKKSDIKFREIFIPKGTRLCQFEILPVMEDFDFKGADLSEEANRGSYGSTDKKKEEKA